MRSTFVRFAVLGAGIAAVVSCDAGPTVTRFGNGISGGPSGTSPVQPPAPGSPDSNPPLVRYIVPDPAASAPLINVGDSILVRVRLNDDRALKSVTITGFKETGDPDLGTFLRTVRYTPITAPVGGTFRPGLIDTTISRYLQPATPLDTTIGPLVIEATVTDSAGNTFTRLDTVQIVTGPRVRIIEPVAGDSVPRGTGLDIIVNVSHNDGVNRFTVIAQGENTTQWPTKMNDTVRVTANGVTDITDTITVTPPADAPVGGRITISLTAVDVNGNPGSTAPVVVFVRLPGTRLPRVYQTVPDKLEISDTIFVRADGDNIVGVGRKLLDANTGALVSDVAVTFAAKSGAFTTPLPLNLTLPDQGRRLTVISYAYNNSVPPDTGWSLSDSTVRVAVTVEANASRANTLITYGRTFRLPSTRPGVVGDLAVHPNGNAFLSNTSYNLLEVWNNTSKAFAGTGIAVGAQPWGLFVANNDDTLLVANSGATTISRVCIDACAGGVLSEDLSTTPGRGRIRTRNNVVFEVLFSRDENTGRIRLVKRSETSYSDRPQYVAQSAGGRIFYSTRPTPQNGAGTIRWLDPALPVPDPRQIWSYGKVTEGEAVIYTIFNADSVRVGAVPPASPLSDTLFLYDHPYGAATGTIVVNDSIPLDAMSKAQFLGSDVEMVLGLDIKSLELTDTTFVAAAGDRTWIAFGEGNTGSGNGRVMMINDPPGIIPGYFSPAQTVTDIVDNASEKVFGLAVDSTGLQVVAHGLKTYMASVDLPFHLRLDGEYDSFDDGAGVAYHPRAKSTGSNPDHRVAFSATQSGTIEIIDVAHYNNRGRLITKGNLYGALRATGPLPGDPPDVILKLFGLTDAGLLVIDLRAPDIKAPAP